MTGKVNSQLRQQLNMPVSSFESTAGRRQYYASLSNIAPEGAGLATSRWSYRIPQALCH